VEEGGVTEAAETYEQELPEENESIKINEEIEVDGKNDYYCNYLTRQRRLSSMTAFAGLNINDMCVSDVDFIGFNDSIVISSENTGDFIDIKFTAASEKISESDIWEQIVTKNRSPCILATHVTGKKMKFDDLYSKLKVCTNKENELNKWETTILRHDSGQDDSTLFQYTYTESTITSMSEYIHNYNLETTNKLVEDIFMIIYTIICIDEYKLAIKEVNTKNVVYVESCTSTSQRFTTKNDKIFVVKPRRHLPVLSNIEYTRSSEIAILNVFLNSVCNDIENSNIKENLKSELYKSVFSLHSNSNADILDNVMFKDILLNENVPDDDVYCSWSIS
jgi:hypothetical protein